MAAIAGEPTARRLGNDDQFMKAVRPPACAPPVSVGPDHWPMRKASRSGAAGPASAMGSAARWTVPTSIGRRHDSLRRGTLFGGYQALRSPPAGNMPGVQSTFTLPESLPDRVDAISDFRSQRRELEIACHLWYLSTCAPVTVVSASGGIRRNHHPARRKSQR